MTLSVRLLAVVVAALVLAAAAPVRAQSLADVAKKEEERRQQVKEPAKVYTNKDLQSAPAPSTAQPAAPAGSASQPADSSPAKDDSAKPAGSPDTTGKKGKSEPVKDQAYWTGRLKDLQSTLDRDQTYGEALQSRINALTTDFVNRDDPVQRAGIERDRLKALAEFDRLKKQIVADKKAIDDFQEEARRAGVPPGWLRF